MGIGVRVGRQLLVMVMMMMVVVVVVVVKCTCTLVYALQIGAEECLSVGVRIGAKFGAEVCIGAPCSRACCTNVEIGVRVRWAAAGGGVMHACTLMYMLSSLGLILEPRCGDGVEGGWLVLVLALVVGTAATTMLLLLVLLVELCAYASLHMHFRLGLRQEAGIKASEWYARVICSTQKEVKDLKTEGKRVR
ncbi:hypothetical protein BJV74DRAFT_799397 [Russula compacta]|nr:hypothetical protein BJV74DRAFT_799397 [Russula compacta]